MRKLSAIVGTAALLSVTACGTNFNQLLVDKEQKEAVDQLVLEAQQQYDKGNFDKALSLTDKALAVNPYVENALVLSAYVYLSKAGLDSFNLSKTLIKNSEASKTTTTTTTTTTKKTGDKTTDNFNTFKEVMNIQESDFAEMATEDSITTSSGSLKLYYPKTATQARAGNSATLAYLNRAISVLCPVINDAANYEEDTDTRHDCQKSPYALQSEARSDFAWALSHLGEAITFYSVVLYDSDNDGVPNIQAAIPAQNETLDASDLIDRFIQMNKAVSSIFPTGEAAAADSMLNALFGNLKTAASSLAAIPGIPEDVTKSVNDSITDLDTKINQIGNAGNTNPAAAAATQNEAVKNALTTGMTSELKTTIEQRSSGLDADEKKKACCAYQSINSTAEKPSTCPTYTATECAQVLQ